MILLTSTPHTILVSLDNTTKHHFFNSYHALFIFIFCCSCGCRFCNMLVCYCAVLPSCATHATSGSREVRGAALAQASGSHVWCHHSRATSCWQGVYHCCACWAAIQLHA